jgi:hypothetical protein
LPDLGEGALEEAVRQVKGIRNENTLRKLVNVAKDKEVYLVGALGGELLARFGGIDEEARNGAYSRGRWCVKCALLRDARISYRQFSRTPDLKIIIISYIDLTVRGLRMEKAKRWHPVQVLEVCVEMAKKKVLANQQVPVSMVSMGIEHYASSLRLRLWEQTQR